MKEPLNKIYTRYLFNLSLSLILFFIHYSLYPAPISEKIYDMNLLNIKTISIDFSQGELYNYLIIAYNIIIFLIALLISNSIFVFANKKTIHLRMPKYVQEVPPSPVTNFSNSNTHAEVANETNDNIIIPKYTGPNLEKPPRLNEMSQPVRTEPSDEEIVEFLTRKNPPPLKKEDSDNEYSVVNPVPTSINQYNKKKLTTYLSELNNLVGLENVKEEITSIINFIRINKLRQNKGLQVHELSYHMVFSGNPGTGKTTVARILAKIFKELNIISKGHLIETDRSGLVAGYVGQTALKVKEIVYSAKGGVLFIDEAYSLSNDQTGNDYGKEAVDTLLKHMEDNRHDLIVIVAGYSDLMKSFINSNPGLKSRFNRFIYYPDYSKEDLFDILCLMSDNVNYIFSEEASAYLKKFFLWVTQNPNISFGNGRGVRNLFEKIITTHANRISKIEYPDENDLSIILFEDIAKVLKTVTRTDI